MEVVCRKLLLLLLGDRETWRALSKSLCRWRSVRNPPREGINATSKDTAEVWIVDLSALWSGLVWPKPKRIPNSITMIADKGTKRCWSP